MKNENFNEEFSQENGNLEIVPEETVPAIKEGDGLSLGKDGLRLKKGGNIIIGKLNIIFNPLKRRHEKFYKDSKFHLVADSLLALVVLALLAGIAWIYLADFNKHVSLEIKSRDQEIVSGKKEIFDISYGNRNSDEIYGGKIAVDLPGHFLLLSAAPEGIFNRKTNSFEIGDLPPGAAGKLQITGIPLEQVGGRQTIALDFAYKKYGQTLNTLSSETYSVGSSALELELSLPEEAYINSEIPGKIKVTNSGDADFDGIGIAFEPSGLEIGKMRGDFRNNVLDLGSLKKGEAVESAFTALTKGDPGNSSLSLAAFIMADKERLEQQAVSGQIQVKLPLFQVGIQAAENDFQAGQILNYKIRYKNGEKETILNPSLVLLSGKDNFSLGDISLAPGSRFKLYPNAVLAAPGLAPGEEGELDLKIRPSRLKAEDEDEFHLRTEISYVLKGEKIRYDLDSPSSRVLTDLKVRSDGYYYSPQGDQLGIGPLPPTVGIPTNYWIFWEFDNRGNDVENARLAGHLPPGAVLTGGKSLLAGDLKYEDGEVIWEIGQLSKDGGQYRASFEVSVTPSQKDVGRTLPLLTGINYSAFDKYCGQELQGQSPDIDTDIRSDRLGKDRGKVTE